MRSPKPHRAYGVTVVALFEAFKGLLGLAVGAGVLSLLHRDIAGIVEKLALQLHLDPTSDRSGIFIEALSKMHEPQLLWIAVGAACYAILRLLMAYGLWHERGWAEWLTAAGAALYVPFELYELSRGFTWIRIGAFLGNVLIVLYMLHRIRIRKDAESPNTPG